jgi:hypothetical protein
MRIRGKTSLAALGPLLGAVVEAEPGSGASARNLAERQGISVRAAKRQLRDLQRTLIGGMPGAGKKERRTRQRAAEALWNLLPPSARDEASATEIVERVVAAMEGILPARGMRQVERLRRSVRDWGGLGGESGTGEDDAAGAPVLGSLTHPGGAWDEVLQQEETELGGDGGMVEILEPQKPETGDTGAGDLTVEVIDENDVMLGGLGGESGTEEDDKSPPSNA